MENTELTKKPNLDIFDQQLKNYLQMVVPDKIDRIQGGEPTSLDYDNVIVELEYGEIV